MVGRSWRKYLPGPALWPMWSRPRKCRIMVFQSSRCSSSGRCLVTLLSTSVKSWRPTSALIYPPYPSGLTETKKLVVPSARENMLGNSFSQVSSPYMISLPSCFALICASQVSCCARLDVVSDSAKFKMTSRKDGIEPVVMAFTRGIVMVGDVAWAVYGIAAPRSIRLPDRVSKCSGDWTGLIFRPLGKAETGLRGIDEVAAYFSIFRT